ncbi:5-oxoprolinase subunit PxpB [Skermanella rosea]|uniref:5-oxoprolinase subunit PxpB n=1 Tax=Skermanella rosea TaxID=1817965 RepID=UPI001931D69D|nr:5-oxoprolinase subunit PxpB [Skermanella rosea]UEM02965.1 5-oxoprolinase subunit PxpB [Skermanella rosea]
MAGTASGTACDKPRFLPAGDAALTVEFGAAIDGEINGRVLALDAVLAEAALPGVVETVPTYRSLLVQFDPAVLTHAELAAAMAALGPAPDGGKAAARRWTIPVAYGGEHGIDLEEVARHHGITAEEVVRLHLSGDYRVYMIGFAPGFAYLGGLSEALHTPRRRDPRMRVPAGTISIGGMQAAVCSTPIPSGWHLLGRTPVRGFDLRRPDPFLFRPGDRIRFVRIDAEEFGRLDALAEAGGYLPEPDGPAGGSAGGED